MTQQSTADSFDQQQFEAQCLQGISAWVLEHLGGKVVGTSRLERWRPQWKVSYTVGDDTREVLVRGNRPNAGESDLRFEMEVMEVLEANGIKVPHIYGWMEAPKAFVMEWIDTEDRAPGMLHTAIANPSTMSDERWQAMLGYMEHLAKLHAVPVAEFAIERASSRATPGSSCPPVAKCWRYSILRSPVSVTPIGISPASEAVILTRTWAISPHCTGAMRKSPASL